MSHQASPNTDKTRENIARAGGADWADGARENRELGQFLADLRKLREQAGQPSLRAMSRTAHYSHTALSGVLAGGRLPSLDLTLAFVRACGGDQDTWRARWIQARDRIAAHNDTAPGHDPGVASGQRPGAGLAAKPSKARQGRRRAVILAGAALAVAVATSLGLTMTGGAKAHARSGPPAGKAASCPARPDPPDRPLVPCDDSRFIADVTIPDGTTVRANHTFVKTWEIQNSGLVPWRGRYLQRQGIQRGPGLCTSAPRVPIPTTLPGHAVQISVVFTAPSLPGSCRVDFKMVNGAGRPYFPGLNGLYMVVNVTG